MKREKSDAHPVDFLLDAIPFLINVSEVHIVKGRIVAFNFSLLILSRKIVPEREECQAANTEHDGVNNPWDSIPAAELIDVRLSLSIK